MYEIIRRTYILILHHQSSDKVVCSGLLWFLENKKQGEHLHNPWLKRSLEQNVRNAGVHKKTTHTHTAVILEICLLTQEILKGPKLMGSSSSSGKYRSHFF